MSYRLKTYILLGIFSPTLATKFSLFRPNTTLLMPYQLYNHILFPIRRTINDLCLLFFYMMIVYLRYYFSTLTIYITTLTTTTQIITVCEPRISLKKIAWNIFCESETTTTKKLLSVGRGDRGLARMYARWLWLENVFCCHKWKWNCFFYVASLFLSLNL